MKLYPCMALSLAIALQTLTTLPTAQAQASSDCLDLARYLAQLRSQPDSSFMHHQLVELTLRKMETAPQAGSAGLFAVNEVTPAPAAPTLPAPGGTPPPSSPPSDLAAQRALDYFYHPDQLTLSLAAAKNGTGYAHEFTAYQMDCAKVVTGNIFAAEGMSVLWEIIKHDSRSLVLKRLTPGGGDEPSQDLKALLRIYQVVSPSSFAVRTTYLMTTRHTCSDAPDAEPVTEVTQVSTVELFTVDGTRQDPKDRFGPSLQALMAKYPRAPAAPGRRGEFLNPVGTKSDNGCR